MNILKRMVVIIMCLGFLSSLFGCKPDKTPTDNGNTTEAVNTTERIGMEWKMISVSRRCMDNSYSFSLSVSKKDGVYILTGDCHDDDGNPYENEEGIVLSDETVKRLLELDLGALPDYKESALEGMVLDGDMTSFTVIYEDGTISRKEEIYLNEVYTMLRAYLINE